MLRLFTLVITLCLLNISSVAEVYPDENEALLDLSLEQLLNIKVTVASLSEETLSEAPVPISVITADMIEQSGALTLKQLLLTYVPGFTDIEDQNEVNIAARGIYTSSQQKILIMINGHRLNSHSYSMAAPDFSISLDKIKQVEVLRGPASSLYGNVSLTATINLILKKAKNSPQTTIKLLAGNYGQQRFSLTHTQKLSQFDLLFWASAYSSDGEDIYLAGNEVYTAKPQEKNTATLAQFNDKYSYDIGININNDKSHLLINAQRSHYSEPFSGAGLTGEPYNNEHYNNISGYSPGLGFIMNHIEYGRTFKAAEWLNENRVYWDNSEINSPFIISPADFSYGAAQWKDTAIGILSTLEKNTDDNQLLIGAQIEGYKVYGSKFTLLSNLLSINNALDEMLPAGQESNSSAFIQYKQKLNEHWSTNIGARYDYKNRRGTKNVHEMSPRLALIYNKGNSNIKFSFSQAFVDATYWNRFSNLASFKGANNLKPEKLRSLQISPSFTLPHYHLQLTTNIFYDQAIDVIYRDNNAMEDNYSNAGKLINWGVEQEITYIKDDWQIRFNASYRKALDSELIAVNQDDIANIPQVTSNLIIDKSLTSQLNIHLAFRYISEQFSPIIIQKDGIKVTDPFPNSGVEFNNPDNYIAAAFLINANLKYKVSSKVTINLRASNVFDEQHQQGGSTLHPYQKPGRWYNLSVQYQF